MTLAVHAATRYLVALREGGSLPAVLDTDGGGLWVTKFRGAGQGARALLAEILVAELARAAGLPVPEIALIELDESFGKSERDPEIQDLLNGSRGLNFGVRYLEGAFNFDPLADHVEAELAAAVVWLDALVTNLDRTARNPNLMWWHDQVWLIDHGAALYFHHDWPTVSEARTRDPFAAIRHHVLLGMAGDLRRADAEMSGRLNPEVLGRAVESLPDALLMDQPPGVSLSLPSAAANRDAYLRYLTRRLDEPRDFVDAAVRAQDEAARTVPQRQEYRR